MILAIDGGKNIGWATFTADGEDIERGVISHDHFFRFGNPFYELNEAWDDRNLHLTWMWSYNITQLVVEGIRHNPMIAQGGSQRWESQVEGAVRMLGAVTGIPVEVQPANILPVAMLHNGYEHPLTKTGKKKHLPDEDAAWLHGRYFLVAKGIVE